jgi:2-polyprenyl-3-methyl-5-hydroxy-6-metoxy-1,4-benzoquinol methylase
MPTKFQGQVEFIYPNDKRVKPQTVAHHLSRYKFVANKFPTRKPKVALDLACGTGYGTEILRKAGYDSLGVDINKKAIEFAQKTYLSCKFLLESIQDFKFGKYDLVVFFESLEHINRKDALFTLKKIKLSLKKGGIFIVSVSREPSQGHKVFHKSEWSHKDLLNTLKKYFKHIKMIGQDWDTATISSKNVRNNDFYIAVCSNDPLKWAKTK